MGTPARVSTGSTVSDGEGRSRHYADVGSIVAHVLGKDEDLGRNQTSALDSMLALGCSPVTEH